MGKQLSFGKYYGVVWNIIIWSNSHPGSAEAVEGLWLVLKSIIGAVLCSH